MKYQSSWIAVCLMSLFLTACASDPMKAPCNAQAFQPALIPAN